MKPPMKKHGVHGVHGERKSGLKPRMNTNEHECSDLKPPIRAYSCPFVVPPISLFDFSTCRLWLLTFGRFDVCPSRSDSYISMYFFAVTCLTILPITSSGMSSALLKRMQHLPMLGFLPIPLNPSQIG